MDVRRERFYRRLGTGSRSVADRMKGGGVNLLFNQACQIESDASAQRRRRTRLTSEWLVSFLSGVSVRDVWSGRLVNASARYPGAVRYISCMTTAIQSVE
ncbi:hypothetical protein FHS27_003261 [Rhodopirellula rubra]|uniref:Uncharacterized protein n=1 Tax=Aporhodopirellula rubra TaxID=980271 RepID=A0A7W5DZQ7_9BACT|nr:hypothetical protein [Aporhodopirellula rubra]